MTTCWRRPSVPSLVVILLPNGKGSIGLLVIVVWIVWIRLLAHAVNMDQCIPHEADHLDLAIFIIDIDHHDGVCSRLIRFFTDSTICS